MQGAGQVEQALQQVGPPLRADAEAAAAEQPELAALDHPPVPPEPLAGVDRPEALALGDQQVALGG